jgi:hypothetical protein
MQLQRPIKLIKQISKITYRKVVVGVVRYILRMWGVYKVRGVQVVGRFRHNRHMLVEVDRKVHKVQVVGRFPHIRHMLVEVDYKVHKVQVVGKFRHNRHMLGEVEGDRKVQGEGDRKV